MAAFLEASKGEKGTCCCRKMVAHSDKSRERHRCTCHKHDPNTQMHDYVVTHFKKPHSPRVVAVCAEAWFNTPCCCVIRVRKIFGIDTLCISIAMHHSTIASSCTFAHHPRTTAHLHHPPAPSTTTITYHPHNTLERWPNQHPSPATYDVYIYPHTAQKRR